MSNSIPNSSLYQFLAKVEFNKHGKTWVDSADGEWGNKDGVVTYNEFVKFLNINWDAQSYGALNNDIVKRFWSTIDSDTKGDIVTDKAKRVKDLNALNKDEVDMLADDLEKYIIVDRVYEYGKTQCPSDLRYYPYVQNWNRYLKEALLKEMEDFIGEGYPVNNLENHLRGILDGIIKDVNARVYAEKAADEQQFPPPVPPVPTEPENDVPPTGITEPTDGTGDDLDARSLALLNDIIDGKHSLRGNVMNSFYQVFGPIGSTIEKSSQYQEILNHAKEDIDQFKDGNGGIDAQKFADYLIAKTSAVIGDILQNGYGLNLSTDPVAINGLNSAQVYAGAAAENRIEDQAKRLEQYAKVVEGYLKDLSGFAGTADIINEIFRGGTGYQKIKTQFAHLDGIKMIVDDLKNALQELLNPSKLEEPDKSFDEVSNNLAFKGTKLSDLLTANSANGINLSGWLSLESAKSAAITNITNVLEEFGQLLIARGMSESIVEKAVKATISLYTNAISCMYDLTVEGKTGESLTSTQFDLKYDSDGDGKLESDWEDKFTFGFYGRKNKDDIDIEQGDGIKKATYGLGLRLEEAHLGNKNNEYIIGVNTAALVKTFKKILDNIK